MPQGFIKIFISYNVLKRRRIKRATASKGLLQLKDVLDKLSSPINDNDDDDKDDDDDDDDNGDDDDTEVEDFALMVEKNESKPEDRASPILLSFEFENVDGDLGGL